MVNCRECLNADNIKPRNEPMSTTMTHNIGPTKEEHASRERDQNPVHINALRFGFGIYIEIILL